MEWQEVNCILEALGVLVEKYRLQAADTTLSEDDASDVSNDLAYAEILLHRYEDLRDRLASPQVIEELEPAPMDSEP